MDKANEIYIERLRRDIEDKFNYSFRSASDFDTLARFITENARESLNTSTLKRIWGYSKTDSTPRRTTLTILANVLGFRDWESYVEKIKSENSVESGFKNETVIDLSNLQPGDTVSLKWNPDRSIVLRCGDEEIFEVIEQRNSSLRAGDILRILYIREGYPVYCKDVIREGKKLGDYVAGEITGIFDLKYHPVP